jgi:cytochrome c6
MYTKIAFALVGILHASAFTALVPIPLRTSPGPISMSLASETAKSVMVGAILVCSTPVFAGDILLREKIFNTEMAAIYMASGNPVAGEKVFNANCAGCHAHGQNTVVADHTLEKEAIETYLQGGFQESAIEYQVRNGRNAMPAFKDRLTEDEIKSVATFVLDSAEEGWE